MVVFVFYPRRCLGLWNRGLSALIYEKFISYYIPHWKLFSLDMSAALIHFLALICIPAYTRYLLNNKISRGAFLEIGMDLLALYSLIFVAAAMNYITPPVTGMGSE